MDDSRRNPTRIPKPATNSNLGSVAPEPSSSAPTLAGVSILIVDDNELLMRAYARALRAHGAEVLTASGVRAARRALVRDASRLDALLLDYLLIDGDAREVVEASRSTGCAARLVLITGQSGELASHAAIRFGACAALLKPCVMTEIVAAVQIARKTARRRRRPRDVRRETVALGDEARILDGMIALLRRGGLGPLEAEALSYLAKGLSAGRAAQEIGISEHRVRARLSDGLGDLGADTAYALLGVVARVFAQVVGALAGSDVAEARQLLDRVEELIASATLPVSDDLPLRTTNVVRGSRPRVRSKRRLPLRAGP